MSQALGAQRDCGHGDDVDGRVPAVPELTRCLGLPHTGPEALEAPVIPLQPGTSVLLLKYHSWLLLEAVSGVDKDSVGSKTLTEMPSVVVGRALLEMPSFCGNSSPAHARVGVLSRVCGIIESWNGVGWRGP